MGVSTENLIVKRQQFAIFYTYNNVGINYHFTHV